MNAGCCQPALRSGWLQVAGFVHRNFSEGGLLVA